MRIEVCVDDGFKMVCKPVRKVDVVEGTEDKVKLVVNKNEVYELDKSKYRIHVEPFFMFFKKQVMRYYVKDPPASSMSVDDYVKLKQLHIEMDVLARTALSKQLQLYFIVMAIVVAIAIIAVAWVASRPLNVEVIVPQPAVNETAVTTPPPPGVPVLPPG
ncbi:MAG: hypothetical protein QXY39_05950 [Thermofilaceae archaeon]